MLLVVVVSTNAAALPPGNYVLTQTAAGNEFLYGSSINAMGQVVGGYYDGSNYVFLWTPVAPNSGVGSLTSIGMGGARGINNRGQVVGFSYTATGDYQGFLWTPRSPNASTGSFTILPLSFANSINSFGQVIGSQLLPSGDREQFLWTPSSPNGSTGSTFSDSRFSGDMAINDFGQVIANPPAGPLLFTPSAPNTSTGTFTPIPGLTAADGSLSTSDAILAINNNGTVLGIGEFCNAGLCSTHAFLWTPTTPNGTTGTISEIPIPAGFSGIQPVALNDLGQVSGNLYLCGSFGCDLIPFLYTGGTVYDLTAVDSTLTFSSVLGINAAGQILIARTEFNSQEVADGQDILLLSPTPIPTPPGPQTVPVTIASVPPGRGFTVTGTGCSPGVYPAPQTLNWIPQSNCTVAFVTPQSDDGGTQFVFAGWLDGGATASRNIVAPAQAATYTASYQTQYLLSVTSNPPQGGTVSGGGWYAPNATAVLTATAANGFRFAEWYSTPAVSVVGPSSASITVSAAFTVTADFAPVIAPPLTNYAITEVGLGVSALSPRPLNSFGQLVYGYPTTSSFLWTPFTANGAYGSAAALAFPAAAINNYGQIVGASDEGALFWTPATPNGSSGNTTLVADPPSYGVGINSFGQVIGESDGQQVCLSAAVRSSSTPRPLGGIFCEEQYLSSFLWTPSSPNGATGSPNADAAGFHFVAINDFGQAISSAQLYTPSAPNARSGALTTIAGIPGASSTKLIDINGSGVILGESSFCNASGNQCLELGFLWTPATPNAASGTLVQIPIPSGYGALQPTAMNNSGQVVGTITQSGVIQFGGINRPFLYKNGTVYDLGTVSSQFSTATPAGINDSGQIVLNVNNAVYLLSPGALQLPSADSMSPGAGSALNQSIVFTFSDSRGWQDLDVVNILINNFLDGRQACYLAYSRPLNVLYLVNDSSTALLPGMALNGSGSVSNGQCTVFAGGSTALGNGNSLALTLNLNFSATFAGNKVVYLAARDIAADNSGWQPLGTWNVPGAAPTPTAAASLSPSRGALDYQTFSFIFTDTRGWQNLGVVDILINNFLDGRQACYFAYSRPLNQIYLVNDAGTGMLQGLVLPSINGISNNQCTLSPGGSTSTISVSGSGNTLTLTLAIQFSPSFVGNRVIYMAARDVTDTVNSGWQAMGTWTVQ